VTILSENGANPNVMDAGGNTALHHSLCSEQTSKVASSLHTRQILNHKQRYSALKIISKTFEVHLV
jgi:hypothetical protein